MEHIYIITSVLEPVFLYRGLGFLEDVLSTQNDSEGQQSPYLASFYHSLSSFVRRESELTSSFALILQERFMARSLLLRGFSVSALMAQVSAACSITLLTHDEYTLPLVRRGTWRLVRRGSTCNCRNLPHAHLQQVHSYLLQRACPQAFRSQPQPLSIVFHQ